ncbi:hypothetical protein K438DRAFT_1428208, partial [Mycena galopus ATCC 62051]
TLRRHIERYHKANYVAWAKKENFESMLPSDTAARWVKEQVAKQTQSTLNAHLGPRTEPVKTVKYTSERLEEATIKWLIATDQPLSATENPWFREMMQIASRAPDGINM